MKFMRIVSLIALGVALSAGFFAGDADAAVLDSVIVTTPDSGAYRGIDSLIVAKAYVRSGTVDSTLTIYFWLAESGADTLVLADTTDRGVPALRDTVKIATAPSAALNLARFPVAAGFIAGARRPVISSFNNKSNFVGDGDSISVAVTGTQASGGQGIVFTWYGRVHASMGVGAHVNVFAVAHDPTKNAGERLTSIKMSRYTVKVDGDRPDQTGVTLTSVSTGGASSVGGLTSHNPGSGATTVRDVVAIGDTVKMAFNLGTKGDAVILENDATLALDLATSILNVTVAPPTPTAAAATFNYVVPEGAYGDIIDHGAFASDTVGVFLVDVAGNWSSENVSGTTDDVVPEGVTQAVWFMIDAKKPVIDGINGDTLLPVTNDTITDGGVRVADNTLRTNAISAGSYPIDENVLTYKLGEALDSLSLVFKTGTKSDTLSISNDAIPLANHAVLAKNSEKIVDFTRIGKFGSQKADTFLVASTAGVEQAHYRASSNSDTSMVTGIYSLEVYARDVAGNKGPSLTRTNVYIDVDDIELVRLFPTIAALGAVDTLEETTAKIIFRLSEPADSVLITYRGISGVDENKLRTRRLSGTQLTNTAIEQTIPIDSLASGTKYILTVLARDLAGNFTRSLPDTFIYDTAFVVPVITRFVIEAGSKGILAANHVLAGAPITLSLTADASTDNSRTAVNYKEPAILKVSNVTGGAKLQLTGTGVTDLGNGRATLSADDWIAGKRTITLRDSLTIDTLRVSLIDSVSSGGPYSGVLDSSIVYDPESYSKILVSADSIVAVGQEFWVDLTLSDKFGNTRTLDTKYVSVSANKLGVEVPVGDQLITKGTGGFYAKVMTPYAKTDGLTFRVKDLLSASGSAVSGTIAAGAGTVSGGAPSIIDGVSDTVAVTGDGGVVVPPDDVLDAPDAPLYAVDYKGADGGGDQGGFVFLTFDLSDDHATLSGYRVYREMQVDYRVATEADSTTDAIVLLEEPENAWVPWAEIDAIPGEEIGRVVVATLDNVATRWGVAAERDRQTTAKEAFTGAESIATPYELMTSTMVESKKAAVADAPVFATLTPEALSFVERGVAPRMKGVDAQLLRSSITESEEAVRAIDNIPPEAVSYIRAMDTPNDAGYSITVTWSKSESDRLLPRSAPNAVGTGQLTDQVAGVKGYQINRKVGDSGYTLVGKVGTGETSFQDVTALNGVRYTYQVSPYDEDNVTASAIERTAMSIRNSVVGKDGKPVFGLFGMDNRVGFDDFFIFADNFGLTVADEAFEPAFDLSPSTGIAKIDFEDFFVFADNFGLNIEAAGKVVPMMAGLNTDARLYLDASAELPRVGEEVVIDVSLEDFAELKGYGLSVNYDAEKLEFVKTVTANSLLGEGELAQAQIIAQADGEVSIAAFGETVTEGDLGMSLVFRTKTEIEEDTYIEVSESEVRDGNYAVNSLALPAPVQIQTRPEAFVLKNNYPNPFNPATTIKYALPEAVFVKLEIYNVVGQVVRTLVADHQNAGRYVVQWDASNESGHSLSSGIYFYRLQAGGEFLEVKKMLLLK